MAQAQWRSQSSAADQPPHPAMASRSTISKMSAENPETAILNEDGNLAAWDWDKSGTMEMNCFLCHLETPNTAAREEAIHAGEFGNANTATLLDLNIVAKTRRRLGMESRSLQRKRRTQERMLGIQDPTNANCATCHGEVHPSAGDPLTINQCDLDYPQTATTGQVVSGQRIDKSGVNLANKRRTRSLVGYPCGTSTAMHRLSLCIEQSLACQRNPKQQS